MIRISVCAMLCALQLFYAATAAKAQDKTKQISKIVSLALAKDLAQYSEGQTYESVLTPPSRIKLGHLTNNLIRQRIYLPPTPREVQAFKILAAEKSAKGKLTRSKQNANEFKVVQAYFAHNAMVEFVRSDQWRHVRKAADLFKSGQRSEVAVERIKMWVKNIPTGMAAETIERLEKLYKVAPLVPPAGAQNAQGQPHPLKPRDTGLPNAEQAKVTPLQFASVKQYILEKRANKNVFVSPWFDDRDEASRIEPYSRSQALTALQDAPLAFRRLPNRPGE